MIREGIELLTKLSNCEYLNIIQWSLSYVVEQVAANDRLPLPEPRGD